MSTGATPEQIEAALDRGWWPEGDLERHRDVCRQLVEGYAADLVPPDHRIVRADENHLTPELKAALAHVRAYVQAVDWRERGSYRDADMVSLYASERKAKGAITNDDLAVIDAALAEDER